MSSSPLPVHLLHCMYLGEQRHLASKIKDEEVALNAHSCRGSSFGSRGSTQGTIPVCHICEIKQRCMCKIHIRSNQENAAPTSIVGGRTRSSDAKHCRPPTRQSSKTKRRLRLQQKSRMLETSPKFFVSRPSFPVYFAIRIHTGSKPTMRQHSLFGRARSSAPGYSSTCGVNSPAIVATQHAGPSVNKIKRFMRSAT